MKQLFYSKTHHNRDVGPVLERQRPVAVHHKVLRVEVVLQVARMVRNHLRDMVQFGAVHRHVLRPVLRRRERERGEVKRILYYHS